MNFYLLQKVRPNCMVVYTELRNKSTGIIHNDLIIQQEDN